MNEKLLITLFLLMALFYSCSKEDKALEEYTLNTNIIPTNGGSLSSVLPSYKEGEQVIIEAIPSENFEFIRWTNHAEGNKNPLSFIIEGNTSIVAIFEMKDNDKDGVPDYLDNCPNTPIYETIDVNGCSISQIDSDNDGINDDKDICPNTNPSLKVDSNGCSSYQRDSDKDNVFDAYDKCPNTPLNENADDDGCSLSQIQFNLNLQYGAVSDIDGNIYKTIKIGSQIWMAENLKATKFNNGDSILKEEDETTWSQLVKAAYCNYENDETNIIKYGRLYNWYAVNDSRNICPQGWRVPSKEDFETLIYYSDNLDNYIKPGRPLKEFGHRNWEDYRQIYIMGTNITGFTGLPGGYKLPWGFSSIRRTGIWWSSTSGSDLHAWSMYLLYDRDDAYIDGLRGKNDGLCIRCIKN